MASSSHHNLEGPLMKFSIKHLINILIKLSIKHLTICAMFMVIKKTKGGQEKNEFLSNETVKKAIFSYGMIISVTLPHILKIYSDDDFE